MKVFQVSLWTFNSIQLGLQQPGKWSVLDIQAHCSLTPQHCVITSSCGWSLSQIHYLLIPFLPSFSNPYSLDMCPMTYHLFPTLLYLVFGFSCPSDIAPIQVQLWDYLAYRSIFVLAFCLVNSPPTVQSLLTYKKTINSRPGRPYLKALSMSKLSSYPLV